MQRKWVEVEGGESEKIIQPLLDAGWAVKLMSAAAFSSGYRSNSFAPGCFVYLEKED